MSSYSITESRLLELLTSEINLRILDSDETHEHHEVNVEFWKETLLDEGRIMSTINHTDDILQIPAEGALLTSVRNSLNKDINRISDRFETDPILTKLLQMDQQDVYEMFGCSLDNLNGANHIHHCIVNGIYDDAELGVVIGPYGGYDISTVGDDYTGINIYEDELLELMRVKSLASTFYAANKTLIEGRPRLGDGPLEDYKNSPGRLASSEYMKLSSQYQDALEFYMDVYCKTACQARRDERARYIADIKQRAATMRDTVIDE